MSPSSEKHIENTKHDERVLARIRGVDLVIAQIGHWPTFHDFEVVSISLDRSPYREGIACDLRAVFYIYDIRQAPTSPERRPAHAEMLFHGIDELEMLGFNHQNFISGVGLRLVYCDRLKSDRILVEWGGTLMNHNMKFHCDSITVVRVIDLDPFRKGSRDGF